MAKKEKMMPKKDGKKEHAKKDGKKHHGMKEKKGDCGCGK